MILLNQPHTPWACMFAEAFSELEIHIPDWRFELRDLPENVSVVPAEDILPQSYDCIITDFAHDDFAKVSTKRRISVVHIEQNLGDESHRRLIEKVYASNDFVVSITDHKKSTLQEFSWHPKTRVINHFVQENPILPLDTGIIGCVQNRMTPEKMVIWDAVAEHQNCVAIGHFNTITKGGAFVPNGTNAYLSVLKTLSVFVNVVSGDAFGMSPVEAMSFGIPMVTGFSRDIPDEFISGWNCLMTDDRGHRSALQIAAFAIQLRNDEALRKRIGSAGRDTVRRIFSKEKFRSSFKEIMS